MTMSMNDGDVSKHFRFGGEELVIDKETDDVVYNDEKHIYVGKSGLVQDKKFISVTTLIGLFENKFDGDFWSKYKALEALVGADQFSSVKKKLLDKKIWDDSYYLNFGISPEDFESKCEEVKSGWKDTNKEACEHGTRVHAKQENTFYMNPQKMIDKFNVGNKFKVNKNYHKLDLERAIYPEILLSSVSKDGLLRIAGQSDLLIKDGNHIKIWDWKTNKELKMESYYDKKKGSHEMMKYPLNNIQDCNYMHYTLQLSLYAWMVQKINPNFIIDELRIVHFTHDGQVNEYVLDYRKEDIIRMLKYYKKQLVLQDLEERNKPVIF